MKQMKQGETAFCHAERSEASILAVMKPIGTHNYYTYILTNMRKEVLYTGVTNNVGNRLYKHREEAATGGSSFTARYKCIYLVYYERFQYIEHAIAREKEIKGWSRKKKDILISEFNPEWRFLDPEQD